MEEFFYSDERLDENELIEIKAALPGCDFGFTGLESRKGVEYKLTVEGHFVSLKILLALDKYGLHR